MPVDLFHLEIQLAELRDAIRLWVAISNADPAKFFGGSRFLQGEAATFTLESIVMSLRRLGDKGRRKDPQGRDLPLEPDLRSVYRALEDAGRKSVADALIADPLFKHIKRLADKLYAHGKPQDLVGAATFDPSLPATHIRASMVFEVTKAFCDTYSAHVRPVNLDENQYRDHRNLGDPFQGAIQHIGLPLLDFPPSDIFFDKSLLAKDFFKHPVPLDDGRLADYIRFYYRRSNDPAASFTLGGRPCDASAHFRVLAMEVLWRQPEDQQERVRQVLASEGLTLPFLFDPSPTPAPVWDPARYIVVPRDLVRQDPPPIVDDGGEEG